MRRFVLILGVCAAAPVCALAASPLATVRQIRALTPAQVARRAPVDIQGVVTYYEPAEQILFVSDKTGGIFISTTHSFPIVQGDRVRVRGVTTPSYSSVVTAESIGVTGRAVLPRPLPATFADLMSGRDDCAYVTVSGTIVSATIQPTGGAPYLLLDLRMDGGSARVHVENYGGVNLQSLLDARVTLAGVSGGSFDGRFQLVGAVLYLGSPAQMRVTSPAAANPASLPFTPIAKVMGTYNVVARSPRVRVRGSVIYYEPSEELVLEHDGHAILIYTHQGTPLRIGDLVDATGFADADGYSQVLSHAQFSAPHGYRDVRPQPVSWQDAAGGKYPYNVISLEGRVIDQAHGSRQDLLYVKSGGYVFPAILRHPYQPDVRLPRIGRGSEVRVSGVCFVVSGNAWNSALGFNLYLRGSADVQVLSQPSWFTVQRLFYIVGVLVLLVFAFFIWSALLRRRVHLQMRILRRTLDEDSARERRQVQFEMERSRVLVAINSRKPLDEVLRMITVLISEQMEDVACWCELASGGAVGATPGDGMSLREPEPPRWSRDILCPDGKRLGRLMLALRPDSECLLHHVEVLDIGVSLAALAIDSRRLYENLLHRSEYDQLTEIPNRFLLEARLAEAFADARRLNHRFALIYIDLDRFKQVNDRYGHRVGDVYLQHVASRLLDRLRAQDTLARIGGDEFLALIPVVRDRGEAVEIAERLERCFDSPFRIDGQTICGAASVGIAVFPDDGEDEDQLNRRADTEMYANKQLRRVGRE